MDLLNRKNTIVWIFLFIISYGLSNFLLASKMNLYDKNAWYTKPLYWIVGTIFVIPVFIMVIVFYIQIACKIADTLNVPGYEIYTSPYAWIVCFIVPFVGWSLGLVMLIYVLIWPFTKLATGEAEKFIS